ncbi:hypothetical protein [Lysinibacillus sp. SGAir0095]|uniref:hypothetical protein n=1 Tax=Lysinibacillus sp. SGAir0095 TaxID=2070463 RepID=UPI0010CD23FF|nr:hypothetical protein [Lysinibacillus sp. SGAir0095]QCR32424.1 hypothetical protein C1N55_09645 [Lysinibacillus sp. SGAir0095]
MKKFLIIISSLFVLYGCNHDKEKDSEETSSLSENIDRKPPEQVNKEPKNGQNPENPAEIDFMHYFKPAESIATFIGDGNEFASFTEKTTYLSSNYVATIIDNGGAVTMKVYRVDENEILLVMDKLVEGMPEDADYPKIEDLDKLPVLDTFLAGPIEVGTTFKNWSIIETDSELVTPYQTFDDVFIIEETGDGFKNRKYIVEDYGVVKTEAIMSENSSEQFIVTSTLEDISLH